MARSKQKLPTRSKNEDVSRFLEQVALTPKPLVKSGDRGRLIFAMDATASREPSWDQACQIQGEMFQSTAALGGLDIQLVWYRGFMEFHASTFKNRAADLLSEMTGVRCAGGQTQIERVLSHAVSENKKQRINALVFVGDCMEEDIDRLCHRAGELGLLNLPVFVFQEGYEPVAEKSFRQIARLSRGAYCRFDKGSAAELQVLLSAVAVYAAGGLKALKDFSKNNTRPVKQLVHQISPKTT